MTIQSHIFITKITILEVLIMFNSLHEFIDYVWSFYAPDSDLYPIKGLTKKDIFDAFNVY